MRAFFAGKTLLTTRGDEWRFHRRVLQPLFSSRFITGYMDDFEKRARAMADELARLCAAQPGAAVDIHKHLGQVRASWLD
jgi:cytochrome P450